MFLNYLKRHFSYKKSNLLLGFLVIMDFILIFGHVLLIFLVFLRVIDEWPGAKMFLVDYDGGYPEIFQYLKYIFIIISILYVMFSKKEYNFLSWLLLFTLMLFDDALSFHERFGEWIVEHLNFKPPFGLALQDIGELIYLAAFGTLLLIAIVGGYLKGNQKFKKHNIDISLLFSILLFFGIIIDMFHHVVCVNRYTHLFMVLLEDGGEMIALSFLTWYFFLLRMRYEEQDQYMYNFFVKDKH